MRSEKLVFVYGSLRRGLDNAFYLNRATLLTSEAYVYGQLFDTEQGYPALQMGPKARVYGELYGVTPEELVALDDLEDYDDAGSDNLYERILTEVTTDAGSCLAYMYVQSAEQVQGLKVVPLGDWKYHVLSRREPLWYFAYGSMLDQDGIYDLFHSEKELAVLKGYDLRFLYRGHDGYGRADLIKQQEGYVEGKLFSAHGRALASLFERVGGQQGVYRPTFVDVVVGDTHVRDVLTFVATDKEKKELAPSFPYAMEMIRGGQGVFTHAYLTKLCGRLYTQFGLDLCQNLK